METWDLYDKNRQLTDKKGIRGQKVPAGYFHIVVHICFFNDSGKMLIQHRQPFKEGWSDMWDIGVGGSAVAGETTQDAAHRETGEEIGLNHDFSHMRPTLTSNHGCVYDDFYIVNRNIDTEKLHLQYEEVAEVRWADKTEILDMIDSGAFVPYNKALISFLFEMQDKKTVFVL